MDGNDVPEDQLVKKFQKGDTDAFRQIFLQYQDSVFSICFRFTKNRQTAEDLCQEIFLQVYKSLSTFKSKSKLSSWIYRIAVNRSLNHLRNSKKQRTDLSINNENQHVIQPDQTQTATGENRPDQILEQKEKADIIRKAVESLPINQRTVLTLQKYEGYSVKEIAEILDCTVLSVQSRLHRAKQNLSILLQDYIGNI